MNKTTFLYEGKAKKLYDTADPNMVIVVYKDDATAFNAQKKGTIIDKGIYNNKITEIIYKKLASEGIPTHFVQRLNDREQVCKKVQIIPLEIIIRNFIAGSLAKTLKIEEGKEIDTPILELCYKKDELGDPMINGTHVIALKLATAEDLKTIYDLAHKINTILQKFFIDRDIILVDLKMEFGKLPNGEIILADEISPDTCRLWDKTTKHKLDKDRFRRDLGDIESAYQEVYKRLQ
ncbi:MAG: phosphoribosylaminoimidazolesuccinocarboxamide synthase [Phycisphaerales bacterium]|nr:phosphoribosylaminoimidazolesuccinocarboxamide synthase [Phycisphaerales bacterium]